MAKIKVSHEFRSIFSEKLMDLGNLVIATLVIGQFIANREFSILLFIVGFVIAIFCYIISYVISLKKR